MYIKIKKYATQESIPVGCVPPALQERRGSRPPGQRSCWSETPWTETSWIKTPWTGTPLERDPLDRDFPRQRPPGQRPHWRETPWTETTWTETLWKEHGTRHRDPLEGTWDHAARQEMTSYRDPPPC